MKTNPTALSSTAEAAYERYRDALAAGGFADLCHWEHLYPTEQAAWEAAIAPLIQSCAPVIPTGPQRFPFPPPWVKPTNLLF